MPSRRPISANTTADTTIRADENSVYYYTPVRNYLAANSAVYANSTEDYINKIIEKFLSARLEEEVEKCVKKIYNKKKIDNE